MVEEEEGKGSVVKEAIGEASLALVPLCFAVAQARVRGPKRKSVDRAGRAPCNKGLGIVVQAYNPSYREAQIGRMEV
jgi:hypothetical protein